MMRRVVVLALLGALVSVSAVASISSGRSAFSSAWSGAFGPLLPTIVGHRAG